MLLETVCQTTQQPSKQQSMPPGQVGVSSTSHLESECVSKLC